MINRLNLDQFYNISNQIKSKLNLNLNLENSVEIENIIDIPNIRFNNNFLTKTLGDSGAELLYHSIKSNKIIDGLIAMLTLATINNKKINWTTEEFEYYIKTIKDSPIKNRKEVIKFITEVLNSGLVDIDKFKLAQS